ncbi:MAG: 1,4-dihydroxy-2-naphthoate polyprenyltransferase [Bacteroidota bacterium]
MTKNQAWIEAARPQTLPAALAPVILGASLAWHDGQFNWIPTSVALICALLIQIGTNFANDYYDHIKGADTEERVGFTRASASGLIPADTMWWATAITMGIAFLIGLYLVWHAGWQILVLGILSLIFGYLYTGGPFPLGYNGLGDLFVFLFFGFGAVMGTYFVNALEWSSSSFWGSLAMGGLCTNILVINNLRDVDQDRKVGKRTLGVLFGEHTLRLEYLVMLALAFAIPPHFYYRLNYDSWVLLPFLTLPLGAWLIYVVWTNRDKAKLNNTLKQTAIMMLLFSLLFSAGIILG